MKIEQRRSNFSQFSDDLWLVAEHEGIKIFFDVEQSELLSFAYHLIDLAIDCIRKSDIETDEIDAVLYDAIESIHKANK